jgi:hypothetical protein
VLEIDKAFFKSNDHYNAMEIAYRTWAELGRPTTRTGLSNVLEQTIKRTLERGHRYPPILLKRKRALDRGEWEPKVTAASSNATPENERRKLPRLPRLGIHTEGRQRVTLPMRFMEQGESQKPMNSPGQNPCQKSARGVRAIAPVSRTPYPKPQPNDSAATVQTTV